jgi:hypothetical protein
MRDQPGYTVEHITRGASLLRRVGYLVAGMGGLAGATLVGGLWATEPAPLPVRTQLAFAMVVVVGLVWAGFAAWALARRPLFALDRIVAGTLALTFSALTTAGAVALAVTRGSVALLLIAAGVGSGLTALSAVILVRARIHRAALVARLRDLERGRPAGDHQSPAHEGPSSTKSWHSTSPLPLGPLALALRHLQPGPVGRRHGTVLAIVIGAALLVGLALLLRG